METTTPNSTMVATKWAVIYFLSMIVITYAFQFMNVDPNSPVKYIGYVPFIAFLLLAQKEYKDQLGGYMKFNQGFTTGFQYAVFSGVMVAVFMFIYWKFLSPQMLQQILDQTQEKLKDQGNLSSDQIDSQMETMNKFGIYFFVFGVAVGSAIMGALFSLIGAAIFKKDPPLFADTNYEEPVLPE
jgi:hypothetical protein